MPADRNTRAKADLGEVILVSDGDEDPPTVEVGITSHFWINRAKLDLGGIPRKKDAQIRQGEGEAPCGEEA